MRLCKIIFFQLIFMVGLNVISAKFKMVLITDRVEEYFHDPNILESVLKTVFVNRTTKGLEGYFMIHNEDDIKPDNTASVEAFQWINNKFVEFPALNIRLTWKQIMTFKSFGIETALKKYYTPKLEWPIKAKVRYTFKDMTLAEQPIPIGMPEAKYLIKLSYANPKNVVFMKSGYYFTIKKVIYD